MASHLQRYNRSSQGLGIAHSFLSLFLLVLSFFVVLTVLSEPVEKRVQQALSSVAEVFSPVRTYSRIRFNPLSLRAAGISDDDVLERIETLVQAHVRIAKAKRISTKGMLEVRFSNAEMFKQNSANVRANMRVFFQRLAGAFDYQAKPVYVTFLTSQIGSIEYVFSPPLAVRRANALIDLASAEGFPATHMQSGLDPQLDGETIMRFQVGRNTFPSIQYVRKRDRSSRRESDSRAFEGISIESGQAR